MAAAASIRASGMTSGAATAGVGLNVVRQGGESLRSQFFGSPVLAKYPGASVAQCWNKEVATRGFQSSVSVRASIVDNIKQLFFSDPKDKEQVFAVYEINEQDRGSPAYLRLTPNTSIPNPTLGDLVPYTNKVYGPSGKDYLGLSAGLCTVIDHKPDGGDRYETTYTHYIGGYGQLSGMGPYYTNEDSEMVVTGGTGIFKGARGIVKVKNLDGPLMLIYTYYITGIQTLPAALTIPVVPVDVLPKSK